MEKNWCYWMESRSSNIYFCSTTTCAGYGSWCSWRWKFAQVIVPDDQLSLAIGKAGQNARLAARLTGWKIDIKSETQFREMLSKQQEESDEETKQRNNE